LTATNCHLMLRNTRVMREVPEVACSLSAMHVLDVEVPLNSQDASAQKKMDMVKC